MTFADRKEYCGKVDMMRFKGIYNSIIKYNINPVAGNHLDILEDNMINLNFITLTTKYHSNIH